MWLFFNVLVFNTWLPKGEERKKKGKKKADQPFKSHESHLVREELATVGGGTTTVAATPLSALL